MKSLDLTSMEQIQGGSAGSLNIQLPLSSLLNALGLGNLGIGLGLGLGISYNIEGLNVPNLNGGLGGLLGGLL